MKITKYILIFITLQVIPLSAQNWEYFERRVEYYMNENNIPEAYNWAMQQLQFTLEKHGTESGYYRRTAGLLMEIHFAAGNIDSCLYYAKIDSSLQIKHGKPNRGDSYRKTLAYMGFAYQAKKQFGLAENVLLEAYENCTEYHAFNDYECLDIKTFIADMYLQSGNFGKAQYYITELKNIRERDKKSNPIAFARILIKYSSLMMETGNFNAADSLTDLSLTIYKKNGPDTLLDYPAAIEFKAQLAFRKGNLFEVNKIMKKYIEASKLVYGISETFFGSVNIYSELLQNIRFYTNGVFLLENALRELEEANLNSLSLRKTTAIFQEKAGKKSESLKNMQEVYQQESSSATGVPLTTIASDANTLAMMNADAGKYGIAGQLFNNAQLMFTNVYGDNSPSHAIVLQNKASVLAMEGNYPGAISSIDKAMNILRKDTNRYLQFMLALKTKAEIQRKSGDIEAASNSLDTVVMNLGGLMPGHPYYPVFLNAYADYAEVNIIRGNSKIVYSRLQNIANEADSVYYQNNPNILKLRLLMALAGLESGIKSSAFNNIWEDAEHYYIYDYPFLDYKARKSFRELAVFIGSRLAGKNRFRFDNGLTDFLIAGISSNYKLHPSMLFNTDSLRNKSILDISEAGELKMLLLGGFKTKDNNPFLYPDSVDKIKMERAEKLKDSKLYYEIFPQAKIISYANKMIITASDDNVLIILKKSEKISSHHFSMKDFKNPKSGEWKKINKALKGIDRIVVISTDSKLSKAANSNIPESVKVICEK